jgi:hypothetical protein
LDSQPASAAPLVSGRAFLGLVGSIKQRSGEEVLRRIVGDAGAETAAVFAQPISKLSWQSYASFVGFLKAADRILGKGDLATARTLGAEAGKRDLGTILRVYVALASAERLIRSCGSVWASYYRNAGRMEAVRWEPEDTVLRIYDFPTMAPVHCRLMEGWMISTMETLGFTVSAGARERACTSRGADVHEFSCRWLRGRAAGESTR